MGSPDCVVTPPAGVTLVTGGRMWADCPVNGADEELWLTWAGAGARARVWVQSGAGLRGWGRQMC